MLPFRPENMDMMKPRCSCTESTLAGARALVLDNGTFRLSVLPDFGGRICSLFYRPLNLELLATEFLHGMTRKLNVHGGWCAAFPSLLADGELLSHASWDTEIVEQTPEAVTLRLSTFIDRVSHTLDDKVRVTPGTIMVERFFRMTAGATVLDVEDVLTNRNVWPMPVTWSAVVALRAQEGDRVVLPVEKVEVQRGVGPSGNELDFGLLVTTHYQAIARNLSEGWIGFRPKAAPIDLRLLFPRELLPHALVSAQRSEEHAAEGLFRLQPMATSTPMASDARGGALLLPSRVPVHLPVRLEVGSNIISAGEWSRPGLQLAQMISEQRVPNARLALWRVGEIAVVLKTPRQLVLLMPALSDEGLLTAEDLPDADLVLYDVAPQRAMLRRLVQRTSARFIGPSGIRQMLTTDGLNEDRAITLSPGARFDVPGLSVLATSALGKEPGERLGFMVQSDHLLLYHCGLTSFLGDFGPIGEQFHPQLLLLPLHPGMSMADAIHAARLLQPRLVIPLGNEEQEHEFIRRCRDLHVSFSTQALGRAEGRLFDGWHVQALG